MLAPTLTTHTDAEAEVVTVTVAGPLATAEHAAALEAACALAPARYGLVVNVSAITVITNTGVEALRAIASYGNARGQRVAFVCTELMLRSELVLADLDTLAPVVHAIEQASHLLSAA